AILVMSYGVSFWWTLPLAGLFCALASILIGLPILRLRGVYFAMVTLVLTEVARLLALALPVTQGAKGITSIPLPGAVEVFGPMLGTLVLYFGWNLLFETGRFQLLIYSALMIALMLVLPNGLLSLGTLRKER